MKYQPKPENSRALEAGNSQFSSLLKPLNGYLVVPAPSTCNFKHPFSSLKSVRQYSGPENFKKSRPKKTPQIK